MAEAGYPGAEANTFFGLVGPRATPTPIVTRLNSLINEGLRTPDIMGLLSKTGTEVHPGSPADFAAYIAAQHGRWVEVGQAAHVHVN